MRIEGPRRLAIYLGAGAVLAVASGGIGLSLSSGHSTPRSAAGVTVPAVTVPAVAATSRASAVPSASPSASAAASTSVVISGGNAGTTTAPAPGSTYTAAPPPAPSPFPPLPSHPPGCYPACLDVTPLTVTIPLWPGKALITVTANGGTITWSATPDPGVALSVESPPGPAVPSAYGGTIQSGTSVILAVEYAPQGTSTVTFNPGDTVVTVINPG